MVNKILIILSEKRFITFFFFSKLISVNLSKKKPPQKQVKIHQI